MQIILNKNRSRGFINHVWLQTKYTFCFACYVNQEREHFGTLRILNNDMIVSHECFDMFLHIDMNIFPISISGYLLHKDSIGYTDSIDRGQIQVMSTGRTLIHSKINYENVFVELLQIWVFSCQKGVTLCCEQYNFNEELEKGEWVQMVSPYVSNTELWIYQDVWSHLGRLSEDKMIEDTSRKIGNAQYIFLIKGTEKLEETTFNKRDGTGIYTIDGFDNQIMEVA